MTTHPTCGKTWEPKSAEHCAACCETFVGTASGDRHRVGQFHSRKGRRCIPEYLLTTTGLKLDPRGIWGTTGRVRKGPLMRPRSDEQVSLMGEDGSGT